MSCSRPCNRLYHLDRLIPDSNLGDIRRNTQGDLTHAQHTEVSELQREAEHFLAALNRSDQTIRAYRADLHQLTRWLVEERRALDADSLPDYFSVHTSWAPSTRCRKQTALERFCRWAIQHDLLDCDPTLHLERPILPPAHPRGLRREQVERIFIAIPAVQLRDALLFRLVFETGLRIGGALGIHVQDLDLTRGDEHLTVMGKGERKRTVLLDDPKLANGLRRYLRTLDYTYGPLFQATKNGRGGPLRYQSVQERWQRYTQRAGVSCTLHQLRHSHATELVNGGVSLATIRKRLGHQHIQTTLRYAEVNDQTADAEVRKWRRAQR